MPTVKLSLRGEKQPTNSTDKTLNIWLRYEFPQKKARADSARRLMNE